MCSFPMAAAVEGVVTGEIVAPPVKLLVTLPVLQAGTCIPGVAATDTGLVLPFRAARARGAVAADRPTWQLPSVSEDAGEMAGCFGASSSCFCCRWYSFQRGIGFASCMLQGLVAALTADTAAAIAPADCASGDATAVGAERAVPAEILRTAGPAVIAESGATYVQFAASVPVQLQLRARSVARDAPGDPSCMVSVQQLQSVSGEALKAASMGNSDSRSRSKASNISSTESALLSSDKGCCEASMDWHPSAVILGTSPLLCSTTSSANPSQSNSGS